MALTTAYLGDVALASPPAAPSGASGLNVHVERFFAHRFARNVDRALRRRRRRCRR